MHRYMYRTGRRLVYAVITVFRPVVSYAICNAGSQIEEGASRVYILD